MNENPNSMNETLLNVTNHGLNKVRHSDIFIQFPILKKSEQIVMEMSSMSTAITALMCYKIGKYWYDLTLKLCQLALLRTSFSINWQTWTKVKY